MAATTLALSLLGTTGYTLAKAPPRPRFPLLVQTVTVTRTVTVEGSYKGLRARTWAVKYQHTARDLHAWYRRASSLRRTLLTSPSVTEAINLAGAVYGNTSTLWALARCETGGTFSPTSYNKSGASGLLQFLPSTFAGTPFRSFSIWSPYANAMAGGWMLTQGRRGEWVC